MSAAPPLPGTDLPAWLVAEHDRLLRERASFEADLSVEGLDAWLRITRELTGVDAVQGIWASTQAGSAGAAFCASEAFEDRLAEEIRARRYTGEAQQVLVKVLGLHMVAPEALAA
jgi:hypothetical protein